MVTTTTSNKNSNWSWFGKSKSTAVEEITVDGRTVKTTTTTEQPRNGPITITTKEEITQDGVTTTETSVREEPRPTPAMSTKGISGNDTDEARAGTAAAYLDCCCCGCSVGNPTSAYLCCFGFSIGRPCGVQCCIPIYC